ncbi:MAG: hypothetical protein QT08_C0019G0009 [archaeon GW2011_AR17]|nr:MAG: hypothetical protein QT08_C0019G0009 [archaeon GW2011_AR17]MBS3154712.1 hypothetical protein [Candidatus Woesearchaeota archaeon]HIH15743.1 hypothetical protein [Nanoarchaeota archaeon]HIH58445.1 hypothetical protein [Nanoarchaeota archaeon]HII13705.1 hypothetical protein [Nanoarchaeota archaeon]
MAKEHEVYFNARFMADKHTHYEASAYIDRILPCTITIPGYMTTDFQKKYGESMRNYLVHIRLGFIENQHHVNPDIFKSTTHLRGTLRSLDEIIKVEKL